MFVGDFKIEDKWMIEPVSIRDFFIYNVYRFLGCMLFNISYDA